MKRPTTASSILLLFGSHRPSAEARRQAEAKAVDFDEHDQAGVARRCRRIVSAARGVGRDHLGLLIGHRDRLAGIPSECDPELSTTSTIQMLPSGWITRWSHHGLCRPIIPCNRRQDFFCAGKIDLSPAILNMRDAKIIKKNTTYATTEMVIAVKPRGVMSPKNVPMHTMHWSAGPLHHLSYFCHRREDGVALVIKLDPWRAIRLAKEDCLGRRTHSVHRVIWYPIPHDRSGAGPLQHRLKDRRLDRIVHYGERALGRHGRVTGSHRLIVPVRQDVVQRNVYIGLRLALWKPPHERSAEHRGARSVERARSRAFHHIDRKDVAVRQDHQVDFDSATLVAVRRVSGIVGVHVPPCLQLSYHVAAPRIRRLHLVRYAEVLAQRGCVADAHRRQNKSRSKGR